MTAQTRQPAVAPGRLPALSGLLLTVSAALFTLGVFLERSSGHAESGEHAESEAGGTLLGLPLESPALVAAAVLVSVLLAVAVWRRPGWARPSPRSPRPRWLWRAASAATSATCGR